MTPPSTQPEPIPPPSAELELIWIQSPYQNKSLATALRSTTHGFLSDCSSLLNYYHFRNSNMTLSPLSLLRSLAFESQLEFVKGTNAAVAVSYSPRTGCAYTEEDVARFRALGVHARVTNALLDSLAEKLEGFKPCWLGHILVQKGMDDGLSEVELDGEEEGSMGCPELRRLRLEGVPPEPASVCGFTEWFDAHVSRKLRDIDDPNWRIHELFPPLC